MHSSAVVIESTTGRSTPVRRARTRRSLFGPLAAALFAVGVSGHGAWADMSTGRNTAAFDGCSCRSAGAGNTLATATITKVRRHTVILVNATVTDIDQGVDAQLYLGIGGVLSGPVTHCQSTSGTCTLSFHRPIDADLLLTIGAPVTFQLFAFAPNQSDLSVQVGFTAQVVRK